MEDERLLSIVKELGVKHWKLIGIKHGLRDGKQCRERWHNHLNPNLIYGPLTPKEDELILYYYSEMGTKWAVMGHLLGRPANLIKNRYYSSLCKKRTKSLVICGDDDNINNIETSTKRVKLNDDDDDDDGNNLITEDTSQKQQKRKKRKFKKIPLNHHQSTAITTVSTNTTNNSHNFILRTPNISVNSNCLLMPNDHQLVTPLLTPVTSPRPPIHFHRLHYHSSSALEQLADLAIKNASEEDGNHDKDDVDANKNRVNIMSISALLN
nr:14791_t:CDS:2 [Entrophospora candida]